MAWLRERTVAQFLVIASGVAALVVFGRILSLTTPSLQVVLLMLGLCAAWGANVGAALLLSLAAIHRVRGRALAPEIRPLAILLLAVLGSGWLLVGLALTLVALSDASMLLVIAGIATTVLAARLRHRSTLAPLVVLGLLVGIVVGFQIPREIGTYALTWESSETRHTWSANGGLDCTGTNLGDRRAAIEPYRPDYAIASQLAGSLGELVNERLGSSPDPADSGIAFIRVIGRVDYGGLSCHLPLVKSLHVTADLATDTSFSPALGDATLHCSASHQVRVDIEVDTTGIASCRNLAEKAAQALADQLHAHARSICGHK